MRRILALALAMALLLPVLATQSQAVSYTGSPQYRAGKYYDRLSAVKITGDQRTDIVNIAYSQIGYQEGNSTNQLGGEIMGSSNYTEFGYWFGAQDMWCAMFVSWCADLAGVSESVILPHAYTPYGLKHFRDQNRDYSPEQIQAGEYTPRAGDLIYFKNGRNANRTNHVGLVTGYADGRIYTIEGNVGSASHTTNDGMVTERSYPITNDFIVAVCCPAYPVGGTSVTEPDLEALRSGVYALESGSDYGCVSNSFGLTLGAGQWYGEDARALLESIRQADEDSFAALDTVNLADKLDCWSDFQPTAEETACISAILDSAEGRRCQDARMDAQLTDCLAQINDLGITEDVLLRSGLLYLTGSADADQPLAAALSKFL